MILSFLTKIIGQGGRWSLRFIVTRCAFALSGAAAWCPALPDADTMRSRAHTWKLTKAAKLSVRSRWRALAELEQLSLISHPGLSITRDDAEHSAVHSAAALSSE